MTVERPSEYIWECACGEGHLSKRLKERGHFYVMSSDIVHRDGCTYVADFLKLKEAPGFAGIDNFDILTNPPYKYAKEFVLKALELLPDHCRCYMFLKLTFLEGKARYNELFSKYPPRNIYVFSERVNCAKNGDFSTLKQSGGGAVAYAWFVWQKGYNGRTFIGWI